MPDEAPDPLDELAVGYVLPTEDETADIWNRCSIAVDTNVLLNVYRYSPEAREELFAALTAVRDRLFVPHQVAREYFENRVSVLIDQLTAREQMRAGVDGAIQTMMTSLEDIQKKLGRRGSPQELADTAGAKLDELRTELLATEDNWLPTDDHRSDELHERVRSILDGRVGPAFEEGRLSEIIDSAKGRYAEKVPPGYMDIDKEFPAAAGDLILWHQLLDHAAQVHQPIAFVTDDTKEDWIWEVKGRTVGPRPELAKELYERAGVPLLLMTPSRFLSSVAREGTGAVASSVIEEAEAQESLRADPVTGENSLLSRILAATLDKTSGQVEILPIKPFRGENDPWNIRIGAALIGVPFGGSVRCSVISPDGTPLTWRSQQPSPGVVRLTFPIDFRVQGLPQYQLVPGEYQVQWVATTANGERELAREFDSFGLPRQTP